MTPRLALLAALVAVALAGCEPTTGTETGVSDDTPSASDNSSDEQAKPEVKHQLTCSYDLGEVSNSGFENMRIIAGGTLENTGDVNAVVRVSYTWDMVGRKNHKIVKRYRVRAGRSREVDYSEGIDQGFISAHQAGSQDCTPRVKIVDTF